MEGEPQELEPVLHAHDAGLGLGHGKPDVTQDRAHQAISGLNLPASVGQDHEVIGIADQPEPGCSHFDIEPVEVDVGEERRADSSDTIGNFEFEVALPFVRGERRGRKSTN